MEELYGFKEKDIWGLKEYLLKNSNRPLTKIFKEYAGRVGKEEGTVRNLYYAAAKKCRENKEFCKKYFDGKEIRVSKIKPFSAEETRELVKKILLKKEEGKSVRKAVGELSRGNLKLALRLQNKYRSAISSNKTIEDLKQHGVIIKKPAQISEEEKTKKRIDELLKKISFDLRKENEELKAKLLKLESEKAETKKQ